MEKSEAKMLIKEFLEDSDKVNKGNRTPLRKAFGMAYDALCDSHEEVLFTEKEVDLITTSVIMSAIDTPNELQDRLLKALTQHQK